MNKKKILWQSPYLLLSTLFIFLSGCSPNLFSEPIATTTTTPTSTPIPPTSTPTLTPTNTPIPTPTLSFEIPKPKDGKGIIVGQVVRAGEPVANIWVQICSDFFPGEYNAYVSPCNGTKYKVATNKDGYYVFGNVQPGKYEGLIVLLPGNKVMAFYKSGGQEIASIEAGQTLFIDPLDIAQSP